MADLTDQLRDGISGGDGAALRGELGLAEDSSDLALAKALMTRVAHATKIAPSKKRAFDPRPMLVPSPVAGGDTSFLGRLSAGGDRGGSMNVESLDDVRTILAVLRAGRLVQRRAAIRRLTALLTEGRRQVPSDQLRRATELITRTRDVEIAYELAAARAQLPGAVGRDAREERDVFDRMVAQLEGQIRHYWDGELADEPVTLLPLDERAVLVMRVRDVPDPVADHLGAVVENGDWMMSREARLDLLGGLRFAGDTRLVPSIASLLDSSDIELATEAARALGRIEDPRVYPALLVAYERSVVERFKAVLAGALGHAAGDMRGRSYLLGLLESGDTETARRALEALDAVGGPEDVGVVTKLLETGDASLRVTAIRTLARIGDGRALEALRALQDRTSVSAIWGEVEDAEAAIRARIELRGEEHDTKSIVLVRREGEKLAQKDGFGLRGYKDYAIGVVWLVLGRIERAVARFERAATRRPTWAKPLVAIALAHARRERHALALASFRRAIEVDRGVVEQNPIAMRSVATCFLRRADEVERDGRHDIARGLLEEVTALDLRRAPSALRFEVTRRHEAARRGGA